MKGIDRKRVKLIENLFFMAFQGPYHFRSGSFRLNWKKYNTKPSIYESISLLILENVLLIVWWEKIPRGHYIRGLTALSVKTGLWIELNTFFCTPLQLSTKWLKCLKMARSGLVRCGLQSSSAGPARYTQRAHWFFSMNRLILSGISWSSVSDSFKERVRQPNASAMNACLGDVRLRSRNFWAYEWKYECWKYLCFRPSVN